MTEKVAGTIAVLAVVAIGAYFIYQGLTDDDSVGSVPVEESGVAKIAWAFDPAGTDATDAPLTAVSVISLGKTYDAGTYQGNCFAIEGSNWELLPGEIAGAICWWAGGGTELGVFEENGERVVKKGALDEGAAEEPGVRGEFSPLLILKSGESVLLKTRLTQGARGLGIELTPVEVLEDSRCPIDVRCIQAGTIRVRTIVKSGGSEREAVFTLGIVETSERETITLVAAEPAPYAGKPIAPSSYVFTFGIEKREQPH